MPAMEPGRLHRKRWPPSIGTHGRVQSVCLAAIVGIRKEASVDAPLTTAAMGAGLVAIPRIRIHLGTLLWRFETEPRRGDFCDLFRELYGIRREAAWRIARTIVRAAYLHDWHSVDDALAIAQVFRTANQNVDPLLEDNAAAALAVLWAGLCESELPQ